LSNRLIVTLKKNTVSLQDLAKAIVELQTREKSRDPSWLPEVDLRQSVPSSVAPKGSPNLP